MTVALITISPLAIVQQWGVQPPFFEVPGLGEVHAAQAGWSRGNYLLASVTLAGAPPTQWATVTGTTLALNGSTLTITTTYTAGSPTSAQLITYAATKRQTKMLGGTSVSSVSVPTDPGTLAFISLAYTKAVATGTFTMPWFNTNTSQWITLSNAAIQNAAQSVGQFLAGCLTSELNAVSGINAGTITTQAQVDALF